MLRGELKEIMIRREAEVKQKILFIVSTTSQAELFGTIGKELPNWDILAININRNLSKRVGIGRVLQRLNFPYETAETPDRRKAKKTIKEVQPDIVVVGHDIEPEQRIFVGSANSMGIPTLLVQDGIWLSSKELDKTSSFRLWVNYWFYLPLRLFRFIKNRDCSCNQKIEILWLELRYGAKGRKLGLYGHGGCSKMAVFSNAVKELRVSEGIEPERIVVTGSPKFDEVFYYRKVDCKQRICEQWGIPQEYEIITLLTQNFVGYWGVEQTRKFVLTIAKVTMSLPNTKLIIKVHPVEFEDEYHEIAKELDFTPIICKNIILPELLGASSLIITVSSTAAIEAMAAEKPVIIVNLFNEPWPLFYKGSGAMYVDREEDILPAVKKALFDPQAREEMRAATEKFVYEQAHLQDGQASKRIADLILSMSTNQNPHKVYALK